MKKFLEILFFSFFISTTFVAFASVKDLCLKECYIFNSSSSVHKFSLKFPKSWQIKSLDDKTEVISPTSKTGSDDGFVIQEFNDQSYKAVINYFASATNILLETKDIFISGNGEDFLGKESVYQNKTSGEKETITLLKRGRTVIAIKKNGDQYKDIYAKIIDSFQFTDNWHTYVDGEHRFSFIYPKNFILTNDDGSVNIKPSSGNGTIFTISKDKENSKITYTDRNSYKNYALEMMDSFSFFDLDVTGKLNFYQNFPDVPDLLPNAEAINVLSKDGIIKGYDDGNFRPDGEITRAELTKMIVATRTTPDLNDFNNCFPDVKKEWFAAYICYAKSNNWVSGFIDGNFHPNDKVTRVEAIKIIVSGFFNGKISPEELINTSVSDVKTIEWYGKYFIFADNRNLLDRQHVVVNGSSYQYLPLKNITRKEVAETIFRIKNLR